jgi:hypothetical protein
MAVEPMERPEQVSLMLEEINGRLQDISARSEAVMSRAGLLVASATVSASLIGVKQSSAFWAIVALVMSLGGALAGLSVLFPVRWQYVSLPETRIELYRRPVSSGKLWLFDVKADFYEGAVQRLNFQGWAVRIGFGLLALAILAILIGLGIGG